MGDEQKDRLGDKLRDVERGREDDYFKRRDRELLEKMRREEKEDDEEKEDEKKKGSSRTAPLRVNARGASGPMDFSIGQARQGAQGEVVVRVIQLDEQGAVAASQAGAVRLVVHAHHHVG